MKNIYIVPTDKPSRLYIGNNGNFVFGMIQTSIQSRNDDFTNQNIYITSDEKLPYSSEIFHTGAFYHIDFGGDVHIINKDTHYPNPNFCKRIILTTDESLFKYGVQAIDDNFLEWFVKNPSCEEVEVVDVRNLGVYGSYYPYKIIIPSEEPDYTALLQPVGTSQETLEEICPICETNRLIDGACKECTELLCKPISVIEKQETLEEAAARYTCGWGENDDEKAFMAGAKWQQEQIGKSEFLQRLRGTLSDAEARRLIFETFNK